MQRWEYRVISPDLKHLAMRSREEHMNELGREGWELVAVLEGGIYYFKRPLFDE